MIVDRINVLPKKVEIVSKIISISCIVFFLIITSFSIIYSKIDGINIVAIIFGTLTALPLVDLLLSFKNHKSSAILLAKKICRHHQNRTDILSDSQLEFITYIINNVSEKVFSIIAFGDRGTGKTTAALNLIENMFLYSDKQILSSKKEIIYISCLTQKEEIDDLFRITVDNKIKGKIIFIDDIEEMGEAFLINHVNRFKISNASIIIIYNRNQTDQKINNALNNNQFCFSQNIPHDNQTSEKIHELNCEEKELFTTLYVLCKVYSLLNQEILWKILGYKKSFVIKCVKKFRRNEWFHYLLSDNKYVYCTCQMPERELVVSRSCLDKIVHLDDTYIDPLCKWSFILHSSIDLIKNVNSQSNIIEKIFDRSCDSGNYMFMYEILSKQSREKKELFKYQQATLAFHMGKHDEAFRIYDQLITNSNSSERNLLMLGIIEACHGSCDEKVIIKISDFLKELENYDGYVFECANYWRLHIRTEQGNFNGLTAEQLKSAFLSIANKLTAYDNERICREIIQRCYTDCIRCFYIVGLTCPDDVKESFLAFLGNNKNKREYYENLYLNANQLHYIDIPEKNLEHEDYKSMVSEALKNYDTALGSGYGDKKSLMATRLKKCDLEMALNDCDCAAINDEIEKFKDMASWQKVDVFVAYACTLQMKLLITKQENISNDNGFLFSTKTKKKIMDNYKTAYDCYTRFKNCYGTARLQFLLSLYNILENDKNRTKEIDKINKLIEDYPFLLREKQISSRLREMSKLRILTVIRLYPIILQ